MQTSVKIVHLFALALWLGSMVFFSFNTALPIIRQMEALAESKPEWLPGLEEKKQGTRLAGEALTVVFDRYFPFQVGCGVGALMSAFQWLRIRGAVHKVRFAVIGLALVLAFVNALVLGPKVHELRNERYNVETVVAEKANEEFGRWHAYSLVADMTTLVLVAIALSLALAMPNSIPSSHHASRKT